MTEGKRQTSNARLVGRMVFLVVLMFGFGFAMAPFYDAICEFAGLKGKVPKEASGPEAYIVDQGREMSMEFLTSVNGEMPLTFRVEKPKLKIHPGQYYTIKFYAENTSEKRVVGQAIPSIAPMNASRYLQKTQCFCFSEQVFEPHQEREMPVRFVVAPEVPNDVKEMTLSYTFFDITAKKQN